MTNPATKMCPLHGTPMRNEPLTRFDGSQIGSLTVDVCDACDSEADADIDAFVGRALSGDFPEVGPS